MSEQGGEVPAGDVLDAHLHLWDLGTGDYAWNTPSLGRAHASFGAAEAGATLASAGVRQVLLVQAADTEGDSVRVFAAAAEQPWVAGVVAWVPLDDPRRAGALLDRWAATGLLRGVRMLLHDHPDPDLLDAPDVRVTLAEVAARGLPLDVPDAWPRLWPATTRLVESTPGLVVVLDHLGKPRLELGTRSPASDELFRAWERDLRRLGEHPSVVAKLSGLDAALAPGTVPDARSFAPLVDAALAAFGPDRLMFGGDWPVSLQHTSYADLVDAVRTALRGLGADERSAVLGGTARRVYLDRSTEAGGRRHAQG